MASSKPGPRVKEVISAEAVERGDHFGEVVQTVPETDQFRDDLVVGSPLGDLGAAADAGGLHLVLESADGLTATGNQFWSQNTPGIADSAEDGDRFALT